MPKNEFFFKVLILGDSAVGKTCVITRYTDNRFEKNYLSTTGIDYKLKNIKLDDGKNVKLQIWDTLGQERYRSLTKNYYKSAQGIILIYDITNRETFENVRNWIKSINAEADERVVIILVGNKCDFEENRQVSKEEGEQLAQELNLPFFECSAKENKNIIETFNGLTEKLIINYQKVEGKGVKLQQKKAGGNTKNFCC